ncbi:insulinase family protein [Sneathiella sp. P13V-1]|uniref:M16 family metallopeptidase n=1 Tax=Sneathiella sp. P13V-1 TaxID=2697366 RepID=UPI00187B6627|nr:pitrilysin family protein [Sneathiella sp. P13V-1]MBE7638499.1 insulinase family protein [Sneathiella sp. P13V-1]
MVRMIFSSSKAVAAFLLTSVIIMSVLRSAEALEIQQVTSPGGVKAWLVEEKSIPIISMEVIWKGGSVAVPKEKAGLAHLMASTMDEGADELDSEAFQKRLSDLAISLSFSASKENFSGSLKTLSQNREEAFQLFSKAITDPRFDQEPVERIKGQILVSLNQKKSNPNSIAGRKWFEKAFEGNPLSIPSQGYMETLEMLTPADLKEFKSRLIALDNIYISVVGDIDADTLGRLLDETFGKLPKENGVGKALEMTAALPANPIVDVTDMTIPQSVVIFGGQGVKRDDPDYYAAYVLNYILGGGGFASRLNEEIREKRGLVYSVYSYLSPYRSVGLQLGGFGTSNKSVGEAIGLVKAEFQKIRENGVTERELAAAKTYLNGSFPLRLSSNNKIANIMVGMQLSELEPSYLSKRADLINAVTNEDIKRAALRLTDPEKMIITVVGQPEGL